MLLPLLLTAQLVQAQECDVKALTAEIAEASPRAVAELYVQLADCDATAANKAATAAFAKILSGDAGVKAAAAGVRVGAAPVVRDWVEGLISDERASTLAGMGGTCADEPALVGFFVESEATLGERFWRDRWHRALSDCHAPEIQDLLRNAFQDEAVQHDGSRFGSILEVFCSNARREAIPWLKALIFTTSEENQLHVMSAFANAAGVGTLEGMDAEAAQEAVVAILEVAPRVPPKVVEQARITLQSLGATSEADNLAAVRYAAEQQPDGRFMWGAIAVETATCKKGDTRLGVHHAPVYEPGHRWPDQMQAVVDDAVQAGWELELADKCKGTGRTEVIISSAPFADEDAYTTWRDEQLREIRKRSYDKIEEAEAPAPVLD
jgi:rRNA maturation protein Nop10